MTSDSGVSDHYARRRQRTEVRIVTAATELFTHQGYAATSLREVAQRAGVSERNLYQHFASKVVLFQRVVEVGIVGDVGAEPMTERPWSRAAMTAPTLADRVEAFAAGVAEMTGRLEPLMAVNAEVENSEPAVRESAGHWRRATRDYLYAFWDAAARDGLLPPDTDVEWLAATTAILSAAESRLLISRTFGWDAARYQQWLVRTWLGLAARP